MGYKNNDKSDPQGLIASCGSGWSSFKKIDEAHDQWDIVYGNGKHDYIVYVLTDGTKPKKLQFGPLDFNYEPFYVGYGSIINRLKETAKVGRQKDKYTEKTARLINIQEVLKGQIRKIIIGRYFTKEKAMLVERKVIYTIRKDLLTNASFNFCELQLLAADCNVMCECEYNEITKGVLTC